jgi:hypothetical protein
VEERQKGRDGEKGTEGGKFTYRLPVHWGNNMISVLGACLHRVDDPDYFINVAPCFHRVGENSANLFLLIDNEDGADGVELRATGRDFLVGGIFFSVEPKKTLACHYNWIKRSKLARKRRELKGPIGGILHLELT